MGLRSSGFLSRLCVQVQPQAEKAPAPYLMSDPSMSGDISPWEASPTSLRELGDVLVKAEQKFKRRLDPPLVIGLLRRVIPPDQAEALLDNEHHPDHLGTVWFERLTQRACQGEWAASGRVGEA